MKQLSKKLSEPFVRLFSRVQINIIYACPSLCGIVSKVTFNSYQNRGLFIKRSLSVAAQVPRAIARNWHDKREKRLVLPRVCFIVTTRCTLKCDKCLAHVPDLGSQRDVPMDEMLADIRAFLSCVDFVYSLCIGGGEPLLHPDLDKIIRFCADSGKIGNIVVSTNGTIIPDEKILAAMQDAKVRVNLSEYPASLQPNLERIKAVLDEYGIYHFVIPAANNFWIDSDSFGPLKEGSPAQRFSDCFCRLYYVYLAGRLHPCCQSAFLTFDGRIQACEGDYINVRNVSPATFREQIKALRTKESIAACAYCMGSNYKSPIVPPAVQRHDKEPPA